MSTKHRMFSEHWYRVAHQRIGLRPTVRTRRQLFRGEAWRVLCDPYNNQFYRLRPAAYDFVARLQPDRTVEEVWQECLERNPDEAPGQEEVIHLLAQLYHANLLQLDLPPDAEQLFERYRKRKQQEQRSFWSNIMFAHFPLLDPDAFLNRFRFLVRALFSRAGAVAWLIVVALALKVVLENTGRLGEQSQGILAPGNLFLLYIGLVLIKTIHEFGHAFACKSYGGEVHVMGIMLMIFTPIPYMDASSSWAFRQRRARILVGASGMIVEIFTAALAALVWAGTGPGTLNSLAYNMMFIASVSTLLFNGNPLLRYDGYYILSDLADIPNLYTRAQQQLRHLAERFLLGRKDSRSPTGSRREAAWLASYGVLSGVYRVVVFTSIVLFVSRRFLLAGVVMAAVCIVSWILVPAGRFLHYLATDPALERNRVRALAGVGAAAALFFLLVGVLPVPARFSAPGVLMTEGFQEIVSLSDGFLASVESRGGRMVSGGDALAVLDHPELDLELRVERALARQAEARERLSLSSATADLDAIRRFRGVIAQRIDHLLDRTDKLHIHAPAPGFWATPDIEELIGLWMPRGTRLGFLVPSQEWYFSAIISQEQADRIFDPAARPLRIRLKGQAEFVLTPSDWRIVPAEQDRLPSAALGWHGGGDVAVALGDPQGDRAAESFFEVRASVEPRADVALLHGRTGRIVFALPPESVWHQASRRVRQLLQKRNRT